MPFLSDPHVLASPMGGLICKFPLHDEVINWQSHGSRVSIPICTMNSDIRSKSGWTLELSSYIPGYNLGWSHGYVLHWRCSIWKSYLPKRTLIWWINLFILHCFILRCCIWCCCVNTIICWGNNKGQRIRQFMCFCCYYGRWVCCRPLNCCCVN